MAKVRAKFTCSYIESSDNNSCKTAHFNAVYSGEGNEDFTELTPGGNLSITISKTAKAADAFEQGKDYYLDFTPVD
ncbi:hypothetical protein PL373_13225 [Tenacibaculum maritimum]|nr:hypothetical protein [Tenacibaculum maritimum]MDB0600313.1 hypothetical protein [Tenacibaculum maritimum]MDB0602091.1 hypothetical protein [Tenacibaculum maritimum]MDB0610823.1 hypothetical protein [Tenacibaculum maritimum]